MKISGIVLQVVGEDQLLISGLNGENATLKLRSPIWQIYYFNDLFKTNNELTRPDKLCEGSGEGAPAINYPNAEKRRLCNGRPHHGHFLLCGLTFFKRSFTNIVSTIIPLTMSVAPSMVKGLFTF